MTTLYIKEMSCNHCVQRIGALLSELNLEHTISLEEKTVSVDTVSMDLTDIINELDDIGFTATVVK